MSAISNVPSAASHYQATPAYRANTQASPFNFARALKVSGSARPAKNPPANQNAPYAPSVLQQKLPLGLLLSVTPPPATSSQSNTDFQALRTALRSGNLTAAQQAYLRLQGDSELLQSAQSSSKSSSPPVVASAVSITKDNPNTAATSATPASAATPSDSNLNVTG